MMMLTAENLKTLPPLYSQDNAEDPMVWVKFFTPWTSWTWLAMEYNPTERMFFGMVHGQESELGYFSLDELTALAGPAGLRVERDICFQPCRLSETINPCTA